MVCSGEGGVHVKCVWCVGVRVGCMWSVCGGEIVLRAITLSLSLSLSFSLTPTLTVALHVISRSLEISL